MSTLKQNILRRIALCIMVLFVAAALFSGPAVSAANPEPSTLTIFQTTDNLDKTSEPIDYFVFELQIFIENEITIAGTVTWNDYNNVLNLRPANTVVYLYQNGILYDTLTQQLSNSDTVVSYEFTVPATDSSGTPYIYTVGAPSVMGYYMSVLNYDITYRLLTRMSAPLAEEPPVSDEPDIVDDSDETDIIDGSDEADIIGGFDEIDEAAGCAAIMPTAVPSATHISDSLPAAELARIQATYPACNFEEHINASQAYYTFMLAPGQQIEIFLNSDYEFTIKQTGALRNGTSASLDASRASASVSGADDEAALYPNVSGALQDNTTANAQFGYKFPSPAPTSKVPLTGDSSDIIMWVLIPVFFVLPLFIFSKRRAKNI